MKSDNELIAEFMGVEHKPDPCVKSKELFWHYDEINCMSSALSFDTSWDWLMPVVEKIETLGYYPTFQYLRSEKEEGRHFFNIVDASHQMITTHIEISKILAVYKSIVDFIKWYNQQAK